MRNEPYVVYETPRETMDGRPVENVFFIEVGKRTSLVSQRLENESVEDADRNCLSRIVQ